jgi:hypothetical protein
MATTGLGARQPTRSEKQNSSATPPASLREGDAPLIQAQSPIATVQRVLDNPQSVRAGDAVILQRALGNHLVGQIFRRATGSALSTGQPSAHLPTSAPTAAPLIQRAPARAAPTGPNASEEEPDAENVELESNPGEEGAVFGAPTPPAAPNEADAGSPDGTVQRSAQITPQQARTAFSQRSLANIMARINRPALVVQRDILSDPTVGEYVQNAVKSEREKIEEAIANEDIGAIKDIANYRLATREQRYRMLHLLIQQRWVGPYDEEAIWNIWDSFDEKLPEAAGTKEGLVYWRYSVEEADVDELPLVMRLKRQFAADIYAEVRAVLDQNLQFVDGEIARLGLSGAEKELTPMQRFNLDDLQRIAGLLDQTAAARKALCEIPVGFNENPAGPPPEMGNYGTAEAQESGVQSEENRYEQLTIAYFDSKQPPNFPGDEGMASWAKIKEHDDKLNLAFRSLADAYPVLYALARKDAGELGRFAQSDPQAAFAVASTTLLELRKNIVGVQPKIGKDLLYGQFQPVYERLFDGGKSQSQIDWSTPFYNWLAHEDLRNQESTEFWKAIGLASLQAGMFIVAGLATGGVGAALLAGGLGLSVYQATDSWDKYRNLAMAANSAATSKSDIVASHQVDSALASAILDSAFALIDFYSPLKAGVRMVRGAPALRKATEAGQAARVASEEAAEATAEQATRAGAKQELALMAQLESVRLGRMVGEGAEKTIAQAINQMGITRTLQEAGGWKRVADLLGNDSPLAERFITWRDGIWAETERFVRDELKGKAVRTGSRNNFKNDLDISLLGGNSFGDAQKTRAFLAGRLGVQPKEVDAILHASIFTDPRRMHLYDLPGLTLDEVTRVQISKKVAAYHKKAVWAYRLREAEETGNYMLWARLQLEHGKEIAEAGKIIPLNAKDIERLGFEIDTLHGQLDTAIAAGKTAEQAKLVEEIAQKQAHINIMEKEGYLSSGGVRKQVTGREASHVPDFAEATTRSALPHEIFVDALDQCAKLDKAADQFLSDLFITATKNGDLAPATKAFAKYAGRFVDAVKGLFENPTLLEQIRARTGKSLILPSVSELKTLAEQAGKGAIDHDLIMKTRRYLARIEIAQSTVIKELQAQAGLEGIQANLTRVQLLTAAHIKFLRFRDMYEEHIFFGMNLGKSRLLQYPSDDEKK